jgi:acetyl esterase/lipase
MKYKISREFFPHSHFKPPINRAFLALTMPFMKTPSFIYKDKEILTVRRDIKSYDGAGVKCFLISPRDCAERAPCLIYFHGGGFVMEAASYHYKNAMRYAKEVGCKVFFVHYRLAPKHQHPVFFEDCYAALCHVYDNSALLGIDALRIGVGGDSAGATLAAGVCMMSRDRGRTHRLRFQMLIYPFLDARNNSESCKKYTDTPMWNSTLSSRLATLTGADRSRPDYVYYSPVEAKSVSDLPSAYIETAQIDCLHDDGILYAEMLRSAGIEVVLNETRGTIHGFDNAQGARATEEALVERIKFLKKYFA